MAFSLRPLRYIRYTPGMKRAFPFCLVGLLGFLDPSSSSRIRGSRLVKKKRRTGFGFNFLGVSHPKGGIGKGSRRKEDVGWSFFWRGFLLSPVGLGFPSRLRRGAYMLKSLSGDVCVWEVYPREDRQFHKTLKVKKVYRYRLTYRAIVENRLCDTRGHSGRREPRKRVYIRKLVVGR